MAQFHCPECPLFFTTHLAMRLHKQDVHEYLEIQDWPQCNFCKLKFKSSYIGTHVEVCTVRTFNQEYEKYRRRDENKKMSNKKMEFVDIERKGLVDDDVILLEEVETFGCQFCGFSTDSQLKLDQHRQAVHPLADYRRCIYCGMSFENDELESHLKSCLQDCLSINCPSCNIPFLTYSLCMAHQIKMHPIQAQAPAEFISKEERESFFHANSLKPRISSVLKIKNTSKNSNFGQVMMRPSDFLNPGIFKKEKKSYSNYNAKCSINPDNSYINPIPKNKPLVLRNIEPNLKFHCPAPNCKKKFEARGLILHLSLVHKWKKPEGKAVKTKRDDIVVSEICPYRGCKKKLQEDHLKLHMSLNHFVDYENEVNFEFNGTIISTENKPEHESDVSKSHKESLVRVKKATENDGHVSCRLCKAVVLNFSGHKRKFHNPKYQFPCRICTKRFKLQNQRDRCLQIHDIQSTTNPSFEEKDNLENIGDIECNSSWDGESEIILSQL